MDFGSLSFSVSVIMVCLLGAARCSSQGNSNCECPDIPQKDLTKAPPKQCFQINNTYRYQCIDGYVRKAGTSNLIRCVRNGSAFWTPYKLECIPDPRRTTTTTTTTTTQPPTTPVTTSGYTDFPHDSSIATSVTASTSLPMDGSRTTSALETTGRSSTEPNSTGWEATSGHSQALENVTPPHITAKTHHTTSTTPGPFKGERITAVTLPCVSLVIIFLMGIGFYCYRRRARNNIQEYTPEEKLPMNHVSA